MPTLMKLSTYTRNTGSTGPSASSVRPWGTFISSTMMVMMTASTPSLNASNRPLPMTAPAHLFMHDSIAPEPVQDESPARWTYLEGTKDLLFVLLHLFELRVHHVVLGACIGARRTTGTLLLLRG